MKKLLLLATILSTTANADIIHVGALARSQTCTPNQTCQLTGSHDIEIKNTTNQDHTYGYIYSLCSDNGKCHDVNNVVTIKPHTTWNNHYDNYLLTAFGRSGTHQLLAKTSVDGYQSSNIMNDNEVVVY